MGTNRAVNYCCGGYCAKYLTLAEIKKCQQDVDVEGNWNERCAYQNGNPVSSESDIIELTCCKAGCSISAYDYATWNGKCVYREE